MIKEKICVALSSALFLSMMMSCTPDDEFTRSNGQMGSLGFSVGIADDNESSATRSESYVVDTFVLDGDTLSLVCTVTDMDAPAPEAEETSDTRGVPIYTREGTSPLYNLQTVYGYFNVSGYKVASDGSLSDFTENYVGTDGQTVTSTTPYKNIPYVFDGDTYGYETTSGGTKTGWEYWSPASTSTAGNFYWWRDKVNAGNNYRLAFYAYSPTSDVADPYKWTPVNMVHSKDGVITFDYTVPKAVSGYSSRDAEVQPDILVGATVPQVRDDLDTKTINGTEHYIVPLKFFHALCGVRFKADKVLAKNESGLKINYVTLSGFKNSGKCTFTRGTPTSGKSADKISWASFESTNTGTYTQTFDYTVPTESGFADGKTEKDATIYGAEEGTGANKNFMLIPQSYGWSGSNAPDAALTINYTFHGTTKTKTVALLPSSATEAYTWKAGKLYTYSLKKIANEIDVAVVETFSASSKTKSNVNVHNTGTANVFIRAAVIANWVTVKDGKAIIVAPLNTATAAGQCSFSGIGSGWSLGTDGFYYYNKVIKPDKEPTNKLFAYLNALTPPTDLSDAQLQVVIVAQGLPAENADDRTAALSKWSGGASYIPAITEVE